jgi:NitT/TauT family transport system ATP-binding protein
VLDNVLLPITLHGKVQAAQREKAMGLLDQLGLSGLQSRYPQQLSGGQQSRVAIARALINVPPILFMDEPFASLDAITRGELQQDLLALCQSRGTSVLFITHDIAEAVYLADQVSVMQAGSICHQLAVDLPHPRQPALRYTADFNARCAELRQAMDGSL